ncbi:MAG TPA: uridine kinase [bacterium]|nr:uridine kinase [bacterium]
MSERKLIIGISGGTGSGKTSVARGLQRQLGAEHVIVVYQDSYYRDRSDLTTDERALINYDHPDAIDTQLLCEQLQSLSRGEAIEEPIYDFVTHLRQSHTRLIEPRDVIICEGILILAIPEIRDLCDIKIFVQTDDDIRFIRRLRRDIRDRGRSVDSVIEQYINQVRPMHSAFVEPSRRFADLIVPEGGKNAVALGVIAARIRDELHRRGGSR